MKASDTTLEIVRDAFAPLDTELNRENYRQGDFPRSDTVKDLDKRYRWDLLHKAVGTGALRYQDFYDDGLNDSHIDTVLRTVVQAL